MFFRTTVECGELARALGFDARPSENKLEKSGIVAESVTIVFADRKVASYALARRIVSWLGPFGNCLLLITEFGIWPSFENLHLYYRLRSSYNDYRSLAEAPGHAFLSHEGSDIATFLDLVIQFGWGAFLFGVGSTTHMTISHDQWILIASDSNLDAVVEDADEFSLPYKRLSARRVLDA